MSTQQARELKSEPLTDDTVVQYLQNSPDFFERHATLLAKLRLPHTRSSGQTVSLIERQVDVLRERNTGLERKLKDLVEVARLNEQLTEKIHRFAPSHDPPPARSQTLSLPSKRRCARTSRPCTRCWCCSALKPKT